MTAPMADLIGPCPPSKADKELADKLAERWFKKVAALLRSVKGEKPLNCW